MKKNNNGFTLVELLAVIVVLGIILTIAIPKIVLLINNAKESVYVKDEQMMVSSVKKFVLTNGDYIPDEIGVGINVPLSEMISQNFMENIVDPKDKSTNCTGYVEVKKNS